MSSLPIDIKAKLSPDLPLYDDRHGGPYDRGGADSYYGRGFNPHYYTGGSMQSDLIPEELMTKLEIEAYRAGYNDNEEAGDFKDWG